jgi:hypothetical protein
MTDALGSSLADTPQVTEGWLGQVERAVSATLEHHAQLRLMAASAG